MYKIITIKRIIAGFFKVPAVQFSTNPIHLSKNTSGRGVGWAVPARIRR